MSLFAITPRLDDYSDMFQLADELCRPFFHYDPRNPRALWGAYNLAQLASSLRESEVQNADKEFRICLNLPHFKPEEVKITSDNQRVTVTAKHEEKEDKHGYVSREMTRIYTFPPDVDPKSVTSTMNSQGVLCIKASKLPLEAPKDVPIPIEFKD
ncbi:hypothetical protein BsWGS_17711 [Bradybaena similaris]